MQARIDGGRAKLLTRKGLDWTKRFPPVAKALESLPVQAALIDGEIIVQDQSGQSTFSGLQSDLKSGRHDRLVYYVFDLLYCNGVDLRAVALKERKHVLSELIAAAPASFTLRYSEHVDVGGDTILTQACKLGLEGIVSKREDLAYVSGRGEHWLKSKCMLRQEFVVVGFVPSAETRNAIGSLVLGYYENGELVHAGRAGTGFSREEALSLHKVLQPLSQDMPKFRKMPSAAALKDVVWVTAGTGGGDRIPRLVHGWPVTPGRLQGPARGQGRDRDRAGGRRPSRAGAPGAPRNQRQAHPSRAHALGGEGHYQAGTCRFLQPHQRSGFCRMSRDGCSVWCAVRRGRVEPASSPNTPGWA